MTEPSTTINNKEWRLIGVTKQFVRTRVLHDDDIIQSIGSGMVSFACDLDSPGKVKQISIPVTISGSGETYNEIWDGNIRLDSRQHTHVAIVNNGEVESLKQLEYQLEEFEVIVDALTSPDHIKREILKQMDYEPNFIRLDIVDNGGEVLSLPTRFLPTVYTQAKEVCTVVKHTQEIAEYGYEFKVRGPYTHYLVLMTPLNKWVVCARTADSKEPLPTSETINEKVVYFEYKNEDKVIEYLLEVGFDEHDEDLDYITEKMLEASMSERQ
ncbi:hypothetical protein ACTXIV_12215 [Psychrobacter celer]|uniref:hypothetical protein n=1 Tax=Psychrobacter celer TaxID=306572 RepID=UPI003FD312AE